MAHSVGQAGLEFTVYCSMFNPAFEHPVLPSHSMLIFLFTKYQNIQLVVHNAPT